MRFSKSFKLSRGVSNAHFGVLRELNRGRLYSVLEITEIIYFIAQRVFQTNEQ
jgi:hypothetical protein